MKIVVSTEFDHHFQDWILEECFDDPSEFDASTTELYEYLGRLDTDIMPSYNAAMGRIVDQVSTLIKAVASGEVPTGYLVMAVDQERDVTVDVVCVQNNVTEEA